MKRIALVTTLTLVMAGCASTKIPDIAALDPVGLEPGEVMPSKAELAGNTPRVVVFEADHGNINLAKSAHVGGTIAREIEKHLAETNVELIDRSLATKLQQEIALAEMHGKSDYTGPEIADFAIVGAISQAAVGSSFTEARTWQDKKGKWHRTPAKCNYSAEVTGNIRIYKMPAMRPVEMMNLEGSASSSEETRSSNCGISRTGAEQMARAAATRGINRLSTDLKNQFAPRGYIVEQRSGNGKHIVKVTLGRKHGLKQGNTLVIQNVSRTVNPLTNEESIEIFTLGNARASDQIGSDSAWIIVDEKITDKIRLGQPVRLQYKKSLLDKLRDMF